MRFRLRTLILAVLFGRSGPAIWGFRPPKYSLLTLLILMAVVPPYIALEWRRHVEYQKYLKKREDERRGLWPNAPSATLDRP